MSLVTIKASFECDVEKVWDIVTNLDNYAWRSDIVKIEVLDSGQRFVEYTKDGFFTNFTITACDPCKRWEFTIDNDNIKGRWIGEFLYEDNITTIIFTEDIEAKKTIMKPFVKSFLKKQQKTYIDDLKKAVDKTN